MARKTKEEAQATKSGILDAAERVFYDKGVSNTSLEDIANDANVTRGAIYWHFKNKIEIFEAMHERVHQPISEMFMQVIANKSGHSLKTLQDVCVNFILDLSRDKQRHRVYSIFFLKCEYAMEMQPLIDRIIQCKKDNFLTLCDFFEALQQNGEIQNQDSPQTMALSLFSFVNGVTLEYLRDPGRFTFPQDAENVVKLFFRTFQKT